jgi:hypothetical protein
MAANGWMTSVDLGLYLLALALFAIFFGLVLLASRAAWHPLSGGDQQQREAVFLLGYEAQHAARSRAQVRR